MSRHASRNDDRQPTTRDGKRNAKAATLARKNARRAKHSIQGRTR